MTPAPNPELAALVDMFSRLHEAAMQEYAHRQAVIEKYDQAAAAAGHVDARTLLDQFYAQKDDPKVRETMTGAMLASQLRERTATHLLDSGGIYGYQWERNAARDFEASPPATLRFTKYGENNKSVDFTIDTYHYLKDRLTFSPEWSWLFYRVVLPAMDEESDGTVTFRDAEAQLQSWLTARGFDIGDDRHHEGCVDEYTYNMQNFLSQDFIVHSWYVDSVPEEFQDVLPCDTYLVYLTTHNGCDARGGFSVPMLYTMDEWPVYLLAQISEFSVFCPHCRAYWDTGYDGWHLKNQEGVPDLTDFNWVTEEEEEAARNDLDYVEPDPPAGPSLPLPGFDLDALTVPPKTWEDQLAEDEEQFLLDHPLRVLDDHQAICPCCGQGVLCGSAPYPYS